MTSHIHHARRMAARAGACLFIAGATTGCSVYESSHIVEHEPVPTLQATASVEYVFLAEPFSLIAADSVGLATFGYEIAHWGEMSPQDAIAKQN